MGEIVVMSPLTAGSTTLRWVQPSWKRRDYQLQDADGNVVATMEYRGKWRTRPTVTLDGEELEFRGRGFFKTDVALMRGDQEIARNRWKGLKGEITFVNGRTFIWRRKGFFAATYVVTAADNEEILSFKNQHRFFRTEIIIAVSPSAYRYPELRVLAAYGLYIMMAAAQAATAAAT